MSRRGELWTPPIERVPTPVNQYGLVKKDVLESMVFSAFQSLYPDQPELWQAHPLTKHHLYWPKQDYLANTQPMTAIQKIRQDFRSLEHNQLEVARVPHNILHDITLEPEMPDDDIMQYRLQYAHLGNTAFRSAMWVIKLDRQLRRLRGELPSQGEIGTATSRQRGIDRNLRKYYQSIEEIAEIPQELHVIKVDPNKSLRVVARSLGPLVLKPQSALAA